MTLSGCQMRKINFFLLSLFTLVPVSALANRETIEEGLHALTTQAIEGPTIQCEDETLKLSEGYSADKANCSPYIDSSGKLGKLGKTIISHIDSIGAESQYFRNDHVGIQRACPNWPNLSKEQKAYYWVWFFAAISWKESTCGARLTNKKATHGVASGHLQLNKRRKDRAWRGGTTGESCAVDDIRSNEANMKCGVEIFNELLKGKNGKYEGDGNIYGLRSNSYWKELRKEDGGLIMKLVRDFPLCKK